MSKEKTKNLDEEYSFEIEIDFAGNKNKYYLVFSSSSEGDKKGKVVKLGDGSFGIVFECNDSQGNFYAVKILYDLDEFPRKSQDYYNAEIKANDLIYKDKKNSREDVVGIIKNYGYSKNFKATKAGQWLLTEGYKISDYAILMEKFECTLKDLLERGIKKFTVKNIDNEKNKLSSEELETILKATETQEEKESQIDEIFKEDKDRSELQSLFKKNIYEFRGYDILERMNFTDRLKEILPYLEDISSGLKTLHEYKLLHFDLKPSNIFVKKSTDNYIKAVIGDLGSLTEASKNYENDLINNNLLTIDLGRARGTRHYRSPEQKDYFDIANVEVKLKQTSDSNNSNNCTASLIINDKKFRDTIIEKGDLVLFSKKKLKPYLIKEINFDKDSIEVELITNGEIKENGENIQEIEEDKNTQVIFLKKTSYRTDIFGFGAIFFDLITCGNSPEYFYEKLRNYDRSNNSVSDIKQSYERLYNYQSYEPGLEQTFEAFKQHGTNKNYAVPQIVELILKCILYKAKDTFFYKNRTNDESNVECDHEAMTLVWNEIQELNNSYISRRSTTKNRAERNRLYLKEIDEKKISISPPFEIKIKKIQELYSKEKILSRFAESAWLLNEIIKLINEQIEQSNIEQSNFIFVELQPRNIIISESNQNQNKLQIKIKTYNDRKKYISDLEKDLIYTKVITDLKNTYVPDFLTFIRREVEIYIQDFSNTESLKDGNNSNKFKLKASYLFLDSSPYRDKIAKGDWFIYKPQVTERTILFVVKDLDRDKQTIDLESYKSLSLTSNSNLNLEKGKKYKNFIFYKDLRPIDYYLNMIGLYTYHLFFVGIDENTNNKPIIANLLEEYSKDVEKLNTLELKNEIAKPNISSFSSFWNKKVKLEDEFKNILYSLVYLYLKLTFPNNLDYHLFNRQEEEKKPKDIINDVFTEMDNLIQEISDLINIYFEFLKINYKVSSDQIRRFDLQMVKKLKEAEEKDEKSKILDDCNINFDFSKLIIDCLKESFYQIREIIAL